MLLVISVNFWFCLFIDNDILYQLFIAVLANGYHKLETNAKQIQHPPNTHTVDVPMKTYLGYILKKQSKSKPKSSVDTA